jgi:hypothetical protein
MGEIKHVDRFHTGVATPKYKRGYAKIDWRKSTLDTLKKVRKSLKTKRK